MRDGRAIERAWWGAGVGPTLTRAALAPFGWIYGAVVAARNAAFDAGALRTHDGPIPALSVGNLSVGGTGKTPVSAWLAAGLRSRGVRPAIVLRGYGDDEPRVHAILNPDIPVIVAPDRVEGVARAAADGATVAVLDDAFQHRRARRAVDVVLVSADRWHEPVRLLPAGPWREPLRVLHRATVIVVTRKAASPDFAAQLARRLASIAPGVPVAVVQLAPDDLVRVGGGDTRPLESLSGARVLAISAVGDPGAFVAQLAAAGARVDGCAFPDHHAFSDDDVRALVSRAGRADTVVCTLKDAVKLGPRWPDGAPPLWYVSQRVVPEIMGEELDRLLDDLSAHVVTRARTAGPGRPPYPTHGH